MELHTEQGKRVVLSLTSANRDEALWKGAMVYGPRHLDVVW